MWLLEQSVKRAIETAEAKGFAPSAEQITAYEARAEDIMAIAGDQAQVNVRGVLTATFSWLAYVFGGGNTTYADIQAALATADTDPNVKKIRMFVDSPGGAVHGLFECIAAIKATTKPIEVIASRACSAAYAIAAAAGPIRASSAASMFGSVGVVVDTYIDEKAISIASTKAPKKRPDLKTEEGRAVLREELDAIHNLFVEAIADGRGVSADNVNAEFGEGATLLAGEALKRGMIDSITAKQATANSGGKSQEARSMDLQTLKAQHPDVYAAAAQEGRDQERDRVNAHLTMGEASGDMKTAITAIGDGSAMTQTLQSKYMAAGMNKADKNARQQDDAEAGAADKANASKADAEADASAQILAKAAEVCGVELGA